MARIDLLPKNTVEVWSGVRNEKTRLHAGLLYYRFIVTELESAGELKYTDTDLDRVCSRADTQTAMDLLCRQRNILSALKNKGFTVDHWSQDLIARMAPGLGIPSVTGNGLTLDHTHGLPYIPGSILKGIAQDYALLFYYKVGSDPGLRREKKKDPLFIAVFGAQTAEPGETIVDFEDHQGSVVFFDAMLESWDAPSPFEVDIMNPHYQDYYSEKGKVPPADYLNPNPIKFLTIKAGTRFNFSLAARQAKIEGNIFPGPDLLNMAKNWLIGALQNLGVGGKTRVGYGIFGEPENSNQ